MSKCSAVIFVALLLGACAATYSHPTKDVRNFERDERECRLIARKALASKGLPDT